MPQINLGDSGDDNEVGGRSMLTATGLGAACLFVLLIVFLRGGRKLLTDGLGGNQGRNQVAPELDNRFTDANYQSGLAEWMRKEKGFYEILAIQKQHGLTDDELNAVLKDFWVSQNEDATTFPWQGRIGNMDWRLNVDWNVEVVKKQIEERANAGRDTEHVTAEPAENSQ